MGLSSSCKIFEFFSSALEWIARTKLQIPGILHLLDDFLIVSKSIKSCDNGLKAFLKRLSGKRGVRSVENAECRNCGVWKMRSVENAECGKRGV